MKLFIIVEASSDDDGNLNGGIHSIHKTLEDARKELNKYRKKVVGWFDDPYVDSKSGVYFDISEDDDMSIRTECHIQEVDVE